jgi:hypothetical protein
MRITNTILVVAATVVYVLFTMLGGRASINPGLGPEGSVYEAMVVNHDLHAGSAVDKLAPAFPLAAATAYAVTGSVVLSFVAVNIVAFGVLVWAACWILDLQAVPLSVKLAITITLVLLGIPTRISAFAPGQPHLLGIAALSLAVAAATWSSGVRTSILQVAAVTASPVGIAAPLYGLWRNWRREPVARLVATFAPAFIMWLLVQYWARGGASGLVDLMRFSRVRADAAFWSESLFIVLGVYFLVTSLGGFSILVASSPRDVGRALASQPEVLALMLPILLFVATAGLDVPQTMVFLLPFWLVLIGAWSRDYTRSFVVPLVFATALTVLTQHPWAGLNDTNYFVDWFPYSVYAGRVNVADPGLDATWRLRVFIAAGGLAACAVWRRRSLGKAGI